MIYFICIPSYINAPLLIIEIIGVGFFIPPPRHSSGIKYPGSDRVNSVIGVFQTLRARHGPYYVICGGDFNVQLGRSHSNHTIMFETFCSAEDFISAHTIGNQVEFIYCSDFNNDVRTTIDQSVIFLICNLQLEFRKIKPFGHALPLMDNQAEFVRNRNTTKKKFPRTCRRTDRRRVRQ